MTDLESHFRMVAQHNPKGSITMCRLSVLTPIALVLTLLMRILRRLCTCSIVVDI